MKVVSLASLLLLSIGVALAAAPLSVGGISPGMSEAQVVGVLGKPRRVETLEGVIVRSLVYPSLRIELDEDHKVAGVWSTDPRACLGNGVCPGSSAASAYAKLPELRHGVTAMSAGEGCWAEVPIRQGRVKAVALVCQP